VIHDEVDAMFFPLILHVDIVELIEPEINGLKPYGETRLTTG
jgi:hypothetical protein